jgi:hypothetical protein
MSREGTDGVLIDTGAPKSVNRKVVTSVLVPLGEFSGKIVKPPDCLVTEESW